MSAKIPAGVRRLGEHRQFAEMAQGTAVVCIVVPFQFILAADPRQAFKENILYNSPLMTLEDAIRKADMLNHFGVTSFVVCADNVDAWYAKLLLKSVPQDRSPYDEFFMTRQPGRVSLGRQAAPRVLTLTEAFGFCAFRGEVFDRMGNAWFLRHLRKRVEIPFQVEPAFQP